MPRPFMRAQWKDLLLANYAVDPSDLAPYMPAGVEPLTWKGDPYVSLVAFDFKRVRVRGLAIPGNTNFPEWNLRFYAREKGNDQRVGVVFIGEIVPKPLVSLGARLLYNEPYTTHQIRSRLTEHGESIAFHHELDHRTGRMTIDATLSNEAVTPGEDSEAHFFKEHDWGFGTTRRGKTLIYRVHHPRWSVREVSDLSINADLGALYGDRWKHLNNREPDSVVFADGSDIEVYPGGPLTT